MQSPPIPLAARSENSVAEKLAAKAGGRSSAKLLPIWEEATNAVKEQLESLMSGRRLLGRWLQKAEGACTKGGPFDVFVARCGQSFRELGPAPVHRTVLAIELSRPALAFHAPGSGFLVQYAHSSPEVSARFWSQGYTGTLWPADRMHRMPFADLAIDIVVVNASASSLAAIAAKPRGSGHAEGLSRLLSDAARMLIPAGFLVLVGARAHAREGLPNFELSALLRAHAREGMPNFELSALLRPGPFANVLRRKTSEVEGIAKCEAQGCFFPGALGNWRDLGPGPEEGRKCQARFGQKYLPLNSKTREEQTLKIKERGLGRFRTAHPNPWFKDFDTGHYVSRYVGPIGEKAEWRQCPDVANLIRSGKAKSFLDAGAGTCTLYGVLLQEGLFSKLEQYASFGSYNCASLRMCGERGTIAMQINWLRPLPFCASCKFDLVWQVQGIHHNDQSPQTKKYENHFKMLANFDAVLACNGWLVLSDLKPKSWVPAVKEFVTRQGYKIEKVCGHLGKGRPVMLVKKICR